MNHIVVTLLPVGQGAMNLIEIYEGEPNHSPLLHLTLIDCGIDQTSPANYASLRSHAKLSVDYVVSKMNERHAYSSDGLYLDYVLFTHRDSDHWTLFSAILKKGFNIDYIFYTNKLDTGHNYLVRAASETVFKSVFESIFESVYQNEPTCFFYKRSYSAKKGNISPDAEYMRRIDSNILLTDTWQFYTDQRCTDILTLNFLLREVSYKHEHHDDNISYTVRFQENTEEKTTTIHIFSSTGTRHTTTLARAFSIEPVTFWTVSIDSLKYISDNDSLMFQLLKNIIAFLENEMFNCGFIDYTTKIIIGILSELTPIEPIVNQFLWGGNMDVDVNNERNDLSGVGKLWAVSDFLAKHESMEVHETSGFRLLNNIHLNILERIYSSQLHNIQIHDAAQISNAIENNATSAVALLSVEGNDPLKFLFTGDATVHTFFHIHEKGKLEYTKGAVWTAPHHGSYNTAKGTRCKTGGDETERFYFPHFLSCSHPQGMVIESGQNNKHGLPNITFYQWVNNQFERDTLNREPQHFVYINNRDNTSDIEWQMKQTTYPVYSGVSAKDDPDNITYMVHQYTAAADAEKYQHTEIPINEIFQSKKSLSLRGAQAKNMLLCNSKMQDIPSPKLFFLRK